MEKEMTLGEIKLESLRLMYANDEELTIDKLEYLSQDNKYKDYLDRMPGAINRAISRFMTYKVMPTKMQEIEASEGTMYKQYLKLDLNTMLTDFETLERIVYINDKVIPNIDYEALTDGVILIPLSSTVKAEGVFGVEYTPKITPITRASKNDEELDLPEALARIIPYFVKGDLFEQDEPELSATARNIFESALTEYVSFGITRKQKQQYVKNVMW
jgi:hypothetical protein